MILVLRHGDDIPAGHLATAMDARAVEWRQVRLHRGEEIPPGDWSGVAVLGGEMGAYDEERFPWLVTEKRFLFDTAANGIPILGICLGCQMLAEVLGGRAYPSPTGPEIGYLQPGLTAAGEIDPVLRHLDGRVPVFHGDTWDLPPGAELLAATEEHPHAFRSGSVVGVQAHPEADGKVVAGWTRHEKAAAQMATAGVDPAVLLDEIEGGAAEQAAVADRLFGAWLEEPAALS